MATFQYLGTDNQGKKVKGIVAAETPRAARDQLRQSGMIVRSIRQRKLERHSQLLGGFKRRWLAAPLTEFLRELATLLQASIPLLEALDCCLPQVHARLSPSIIALRDEVAGGKSLADAMREETWLFDEMTIGMVRVGEHAGNLDEILDQIATFREQASQLQDRVLSAIAYPAIVFCVSIAVTLFLMTVVVACQKFITTTCCGHAISKHQYTVLAKMN